MINSSKIAKSCESNCKSYLSNNGRSRKFCWGGGGEGGKGGQHFFLSTQTDLPREVRGLVAAEGWSVPEFLLMESYSHL